MYESKDGKTSKTFDALDWLAQLTARIPNRGESAAGGSDTDRLREPIARPPNPSSYMMSPHRPARMITSSMLIFRLTCRGVVRRTKTEADSGTQLTFSDSSASEKQLLIFFIFEN